MPTDIRHKLDDELGKAARDKQAHTNVGSCQVQLIWLVSEEQGQHASQE
jgi:hypothetical protein